MSGPDATATGRLSCPSSGYPREEEGVRPSSPLTVPVTSTLFPTPSLLVSDLGEGVGRCHDYQEASPGARKGGSVGGKVDDRTGSRVCGSE